MWKEMIHHCKKELPYEACGLLTGKNGIAKTIWQMKNIDQSPVSFSMDLEQIRRVFETISKTDESLLGIYHSHPTDKAYPSAGDIANSNYPDVGNLIISFSNNIPVVKCFQIIGKTVIPLNIEVVD
ncbi:M67 family metallopeptidase [Ectobacillus funiculus]|uniref:M67 family metallopeptidase n=1 Tax=Ectobacillus funiculus TaxID=137993 RepID=A0ABV5WGV0_9BACI